MNIKRILALVLALVLVLGLCACGETPVEEPDESTGAAPEQTQEQTEEQTEEETQEQNTNPVYTVKIVDEAGNVLPQGEYGELVITTIGMEALPLIRYRTGDYTRIIPGRCRCGSEVIRLDTLRRKGDAGKMAELDGKLPDVIPLKLQEKYFDLPSQKPGNRPLWG